MGRVKIRELGLEIGSLPVGKKNCITDVKGVQVGHVTLKYPEENEEFVCTGVTAIIPHAGNIFRENVAAASYVFNGFGKTTGLVQINELGRLESPIMLTNTFGVPAVTQGTLQYLLEQNPEIGDTTGTVNIVVGECNDSYLNSIRSLPVLPQHARKAIDNASSGRVEEGAVGAGAGMVCFDYKGGIGCSSRIISIEGAEKKYTIGCLVLSNFGKQEELWNYSSYSKKVKTSHSQEPVVESDGSIIMVLATDAPLNERQLQRVAKRCGIGLGRTGSHMSHGSGDIVIAFSTAQVFDHFSNDCTEQVIQLRDDKSVMNSLFTAAAEATEEAIYNSLSNAKTTRGRKGREVKEIPYCLLDENMLINHQK
ncbi:aminopeptidase [Siminovitchia terrae]|uniref:Aminopeptidase n=1 Tax=Siminovitchia terrae TaxID=1914933 RepID=A0A429XCM7_SIMTE|nr:P1 family peptidase [Siminovitchia terrae]RST61092.1 S58 family peptidase [Siminovitchia terrae]GIN90947.1 aminopeptidase [Siminovitchia terrae]GIN97734.1 aminopeptidase [Siminovitchia terrae]